MNEPVAISIKGRTAIVHCQIIGEYGPKKVLLELTNAAHFTKGHQPVLPPPKWKVVCDVFRFFTPPKGNLRIIVQ